MDPEYPEDPMAQQRGHHLYWLRAGDRIVVNGVEVEVCTDTLIRSRNNLHRSSKDRKTPIRPHH